MSATDTDNLVTLFFVGENNEDLLRGCPFDCFESAFDHWQSGNQHCVIGSATATIMPDSLEIEHAAEFTLD